MYSRVVPVIYASPDGLFHFGITWDSIRLCIHLSCPKYCNIFLKYLQCFRCHGTRMVRTLFYSLSSPSVASAVIIIKTKSNIGHKNVAFERERVEGLCDRGPMEFVMEIAAHRVGGPETLCDLGRYGLSNIWATERPIIRSLKKASRPHTFNTRQVFRVINHTFYPTSPPTTWQ